MQVKREVGDVSILVNNAGIVTGKKLMEAPDSLIEKTMEVNTMAHFWVSQTQHTHTVYLWVQIISYRDLTWLMMKRQISQYCSDMIIFLII